MALKKWGEVKNKRGYIGAIVGGVVVSFLGFQIAPPNLKLYGILIGVLVGFIIGHSFDPLKTIIYKEKEE